MGHDGDHAGSGQRGPRPWDQLLEFARRAARCWSREFHEREAIAQEAVFRLVKAEAATATRSHEHSAPWLCGIVRFVVLERRRRTRRGIRHLEALAQRPAGILGPVAPADPTEAAETAELISNLRLAVVSLPQPHRRIADLVLESRTHPEIEEYLQRWRPVGVRQCQKLIHETVEMLRLALLGADLKTRFPSRFSKKNQWDSSPPPA